MKFEKLNEILLEYSMKNIKLPIETHFPIDDFENIVSENFHSFGWCEYKSIDGNHRIIIYNPDKFNMV